MTSIEQKSNASIRFPAAGIATGFFSSDVVEIDFEEVMPYFQKLIKMGSQRHILMADEIKAFYDDKPRVPDSPERFKEPTFNELLKNGTALFDAVAFLSLSVDKRPRPAGSVNTGVDVTVPGYLLRMGRALFFYYFCYLVRGNVPDEKSEITAPAVPKFIIDTMGIKGPILQQRIILASFNMDKISPAWIRYVNIPSLGLEARQRLSLNVAGYRLFKPLEYYKPDKEASQEAKQAYESVKYFLLRGPVWEIHSITRSEAVTASLGPLNANLNNLMLELYSPGMIQKFRDTRLLFKEKEITEIPNAIQWKSWTREKFDVFNTKIFPHLNVPRQ